MTHRTAIRRSTFAILIVCIAVFSGARVAEARELLVPIENAERVPVGKTPKDYLVIDTRGLQVPVTGPGKITGFVRIAFPDGQTGPVDGVLQLAGVPGLDPQEILEFTPSAKTPWGDDRPGRPSGGKKFTVDVPEGEYMLELDGLLTGGYFMMVLLYYDGPPQAHLQQKGVAKKPKKVKTAVNFVGNASIDFIYNDNILGNSPDYNDEFYGGGYPWKFSIESLDDVIVAPAFDIEARSRPISWGESRLKFGVKHWMYTQNEIKTNTDFDFSFRQYFGRRQSLELYYQFSPEQYIRQLSDRAPGSDPDVDIEWTEFRFQRNLWGGVWRQRISSKLSARLLYEENYRYYNQPFIENDISAWEVRGNVAWSMSRVFTWNFDYSYEDAQGRAVDEIGETPETSDNSDPSYERDLYRIGLDIRYGPFKVLVDRIGLSFLYMDYYYTTTKSLTEDPYHAGRRDMFYKGTVDVRRRLSRSLTLKFAVRRTERVVDSPWEGDITTDKDFTQWLYWTSLAYRF